MRNGILYKSVLFIAFALIIVSCSKLTKNDAPLNPSDPSPADGAENIGFTFQLEWTCSDPDDDPLTYDVYFGADSIPPLIDSNITATSYSLNINSTYNTAYYWKIGAKDKHNLKTIGNVWSFFTIQDTDAPNVTITSPNGSEHLYIDSIFSITWQAQDNDSITACSLDYSTDGGSNWLAITSNWIPGNLREYSWTIPNAPSNQCRVKVLCKDKVDSIGSDISNNDFTIMQANRQPNMPSDPSPDSGATNISVEVELLWSCSDLDDDDLTYTIKLWDDQDTLHNVSNIDDTTFTTDTLEYDKTYYWRIIASDGISDTIGPVWNFSTKIMFAQQINYPVGVYPLSVFIADFDGDDYNDIATANNSSIGKISILLNSGSGTFHNKEDYVAGNGPRAVFAANFDNDNDIDIAVTNEFSDSVSILFNDGNGEFDSLIFLPQAQECDCPASVCAADFNNDTYNDLAVANFESQNVNIFMNDREGYFWPHLDSICSILNNPFSVIAANLNSDNNIDLAVANFGSANISIFIGRGNGTFQEAAYKGTKTNPSSIFAADLDNDSNNDLAVAHYGSDSVSVFFNNSDGTFQNAVNYETDDVSWSVFAADFNCDNNIDLVATNSFTNNVSVLINNGDGTFQDAVNYNVEEYPVSVFAADLENDNDIDIVVANRNSNSISILFNQIY